jgi:hypothetical protein
LDVSQSKKPPRKYPFRVVITPLGQGRSEAELRKGVAQALSEATKEFQEQKSAKEVRTEGAPQGGFLAAGLEWAWIISVVTPFAIELLRGAAKAGAEEAGKEGAKGLFSLFKEALRKRNMSASDPEPLPPAESTEHKKDPKKPKGEKPRKSASTKKHRR